MATKKTAATKTSKKRKPKDPGLLQCPQCGEEIPADVVAGHLGRLNAKKMKAQRGADYFRKLQAKRKIRAGGRPPKSNKKPKQ